MSRVGQGPSNGPEQDCPIPGYLVQFYTMKAGQEPGSPITESPVLLVRGLHLFLDDGQVVGGVLLPKQTRVGHPGAG